MDVTRLALGSAARRAPLSCTHRGRVRSRPFSAGSGDFSATIGAQ